ncbi:MAG: tetratricopeptide repeat protein [Bdellovibrionales bacterium]|nr:tetratricopeptide repeat protein [Bdellovibrionales bacterium]
MKVYFCISILCLSTLSFINCASKGLNDSQRAAYHLQMGNGHLHKGNYPAALGEFLKANELDPGNPLINNQLGLAYFVRGRLDLAEQYFRSALKINEKFTEARNNLGRTLIEEKKYKAALSELKIAASDLVYGTPEKTYANLGTAYFHLQDFNNAEKNFLEALRLRRNNCSVNMYYGRTLYEMGVYEKAALALDQAIDFCKTTKIEEPYYFSALTYLKMGSKEQAIERLEQQIAEFPSGQYKEKSLSLLNLLKL